MEVDLSLGSRKEPGAAQPEHLVRKFRSGLILAVLIALISACFLFLM